MELIQLACSKIGELILIPFCVISLLNEHAFKFMYISLYLGLKNSDEFSFVTETNLAKHGRVNSP